LREWKMVFLRGNSCFEDCVFYRHNFPCSIYDFQFPSVRRGKGVLRGLAPVEGVTEDLRRAAQSLSRPGASLEAGGDFPLWGMEN
jgi:hypothetical protein